MNEILKRITYLDVIKSLAIFFVCFYHYNNFDSNILDMPSFHTYFTYFIKGIASCGVPLFFMANGAIMLNKQFNINRHMKKTVKIIFLTVLWGILSLVILMIINKEYLSISESIKALWTWKLGWINHLWFLQALTCVYIFFPLIKVSYDKNKGLVYTYFLGIVCLMSFGNELINELANIVQALLGINITVFSNFNFFNNFNPFRNMYAYSFVYFILGAIIHEYKNKINEKIRSINLILISLLSLLLLFGYGLFISNYTNTIYDTVWEGYDSIMILIVTSSLCILSTRINIRDNISRLFTIIGENTLGIYFIHIFIGSLLKPFFILLPMSSNVFISLLFGLVVMFFSLIVTVILKKVPIVKLLFKI